MSGDEALDIIKRAAYSHRLDFNWPHAHERMQERGASVEDVENACWTTTVVTRQPNGRWKCQGGVDLDDDEMTVIVVLNGAVLVWTLY